MPTNDLSRFTDSVARRMAGQPEPERDNIPYDGTDPNYLRALEQERAAQYADDEDAEDLEDEPAMSLEQFTDQAARGWQPPDDQDVDEGEDDEPEEEAVPGLPARVDEWWASLDTVEKEHVRGGTAEQAAAAHALWLARTPAASGDQSQDVTAYEAEGPMPQTGAQFVDWAHANAAEIRERFGMSVDEYLAAMAGAGAQEWQRIARESGVGRDAKPTYGQLGPRSQMELLRADLDRSFDRMEREGRHIE